MDRDFEQRHLDGHNLIQSEDQVTLVLEETAFDEHVNCVAEIIERLDHLEKTETESSVALPTEVADPSHGLVKHES